MAEEVGVEGEEGVELVGVAKDGLGRQHDPLVALEPGPSRGQQPAQAGRHLEELGDHRRRAQPERVEPRLDDGVELQAVEECRALL